MAIVPNFSEVVEGQLYRCLQPPRGSLAALQSRYKIATIINLCAEADDAEEWAEAGHLGYHIENTTEQINEARLFGQHYMNICGGVFGTAKDFHRILYVLFEKVYWPVLVHSEGQSRVSTVIACYRILTGWTVESAVAEIREQNLGELEETVEAFVRGFAIGHTWGA